MNHLKLSEIISIVPLVNDDRQSYVMISLTDDTKWVCYTTIGFGDDQIYGNFQPLL